MTIDPEFLSLLRWAMTGVGAVASAAIGLAVRGLSAILSMQRETVQACVNQANSNEKVAKAIEQLPCVMHRPAHDREPLDGLLREARNSPSENHRRYGDKT